METIQIVLKVIVILLLADSLHAAAQNSDPVVLDAS